MLLINKVSFKAQKQLCGMVNLPDHKYHIPCMGNHWSFSSFIVNQSPTHLHRQTPLCTQKNTPAHTHIHTHSVVASPFYFWLIVQPEDEVGEQLEQVLPQQHGHVKVNVAYVRLAYVSGVAHVAHADKFVDEVAAVASVQTGVGLALVHFLLTPADTESHFSQRRSSQRRAD